MGLTFIAGEAAALITRMAKTKTWEEYILKLGDGGKSQRLNEAGMLDEELRRVLGDRCE